VRSSELPFGRVLVRGRVWECRREAGRVKLLDRPAYDSRAAEVGEAPLGECQVLAPTRPGKVVAVGLNYRAHAAEFGLEAPDEPVLFMKPASAVIGPDEAIVCPANTGRIDYEAELAVVIGRRCRDLTAADAVRAIAGYTCANDVTARNLQERDGQWTRAKSFDTFCPLGPWVVPVAPPPEARVTASVDGAEVQGGTVGDMIVPPPELVAFISRVMTLEPGDVVLTGTPPGVGPIRPGQTVSVAVEGIGELRNPVR
jgi:2-keto-4-pentenoate hydratase/2-oxohepta-3-ene-1,7-dioic acid hydratase in catechol pathway